MSTRKSIYDERREAFARGYRQAIENALLELDEGGADQLREWLVGQR